MPTADDDEIDPDADDIPDVDDADPEEREPPTNRDDQVVWHRNPVPPGESRAMAVDIGGSYTGGRVEIPIVVRRGPEDGPTVMVTAAVHGDEINGTGTIRRIVIEDPFKLRRGTLVLVPVVNLAGFERHSRYMPDRRDLNRSFPGSADGSLTSRTAAAFFEQVVRGCDWGIDLHTAAVRRTNFPNVRADTGDPELAAFAEAFGAELIISGTGPEGSLRSAANGAGCRTLILEAGEVWKVEPTVVAYAMRGIRNCLAHLGMIEGEPVEPAYRVVAQTTKWLRAANGGFLTFHVAPGDIVHEGDAIATNISLTGTERSQIVAPRDGIVVGMTTLPAVAPGDPVCHLAFGRPKRIARAERAVADLTPESLHERMREDLATNMVVEDAPQ